MITAPAGVQCGLPLSVYAPRGGLPAYPLPGGFALALLFAVVLFALLRLPCCLLAVMKGGAYLFCTAWRVQWRGSLDEQPLPASPLVL